MQLPVILQILIKILRNRFRKSLIHNSKPNVKGKIIMKKLSVIGLQLLGVLLIYTAVGLAQLSGHIFDQSTGKPIPDANILIRNTSFGAASRDGGFYYIGNVPSGQYDVIVSVIGYETETRSVVVNQGKTQLNIFLRPQPIEFDPIIVTATRSDHLQSRVTVASEVLSQARLAEKTGQTVGEVLQGNASLHFNSYDGITGPQIASIRGSNADQVLVLLDGLRLNTAQGGGVDLNLLPVAALERIEIVRGGHSALTGSDAIGGAIQLFSRESTAPKGFLYGIQTTRGSFGMQGHSLYGSHKINKFSFFSSYQRLQTDGDFSYVLPASESSEIRKNNDYQADNLFLKAGLDLNTRNQLQMLIHSAHVHKGNAGSVNLNPWTLESMLTPLARSEMRRKIFSLRSENQISARLRLEFQPYYQTYTYAYKDPGAWTPTNDRHENTAIGMSLQGHFLVNKSLRFLGGAEIRQDRLTSTRFAVEPRNSESLFGQSEVRLPLNFFERQASLLIIPALRWDNYSNIANQWSPKLGLMFSIGNPLNLALRGNVGTSFRVPTFDDLYWPDETWVRGNPALVPETSEDYDLGILFSRRSGSFWQVELNYFKNNIENLIAWGPDAIGIWMPMNLGQADIKGMESGMRLHLPDNRVYFNLFHTWLDALDATPAASTHGKQLIYRPKHKWHLLIGGHYGPLTLSLDYSSVGERFVTPDNLKKMSDYQLMNGKIAYHFRLGGLAWESQVQVTNALNKSIYITDGYPTPGRAWRFSVGVQY